MRIESLELTNFRSYEQLKVEFSGNMSVFVGPNSTGKTNIIEAIEYLSRAKAFRKATEDQTLQEGKQHFRIAAALTDDASEQQIREIRYQAGGPGHRSQKRLLVNEVRTPAKEFIQSFPTILFTPDDLSLFILPPRTRRKFMDLALCKISSEYTTALVQYNRILANRNKLLSAIRDNEASSAQLWVWDEQAAEQGSVVAWHRAAFIAELDARINAYYKKISSKNVHAQVGYQSNVDATPDQDPSQIAEHIKQKLEERQEVDIIRGSTTKGPHRDDFTIITKGRPITEHGSRGDHRTALLALKMIEKEYVAQHTGEHPLILLDDVYSELDATRRAHLAEFIADSQALITTTDIDHIGDRAADNTQIFEVTPGIVKESQLATA